jgi:hypothetical protein
MLTAQWEWNDMPYQQNRNMYALQIIIMMGKKEAKRQRTQHAKSGDL